jgi:hypothetical protein
MENTEITLKLPLAQVNLIMAALAPYEAVADTIQAIREQAIPQVPKAEEQNG